MKEKIIPVVMCGGRGTRLWPLSRSSFPKQFIALSNNSNDSFLQKTIKRISEFPNIDNPIVICNEDHRFIVAEQIKSIGIKPKSILLEPVRKGTTAAITLAALKALKEVKGGENPLLLILSSDHEIDDIDNFKTAINKGIQFAKKGRLVTFGIIPTHPETAYGYIKTKDKISGTSIKASNFIKFIEKPNLKTAEKLLNEKQYLWNSGIFLFKAKDIINEIKKYEPNIFKSCRDALKNTNLDLDFQRIDNELFASCPNNSIDISVMEKTKLGTVIQMSSDWRDIGSWDQVWENNRKDLEGNVEKGNIILRKSNNCLFMSESRLLVGLGLKNIVCIETSDAVLILNKDCSQNVKDIVSELDNIKKSESFEHKKIFRPWGNYESIIENQNWKVKKISVHANHSLSLQKHKHRSEHWVVVNGTAKVEIDSKISYLEENESAYIPKNCIHRLSNPKNNTLTLIEVQSGDYLGEDDIIRFSDNYGRVLEQ